MNEYSHHVSGFFEHREDAESALSELVKQGLPSERLHLMAAESNAPVPGPPAGSKEVLKDVLQDGAIGAAIGTGIGALAEIALVAANVSLFIASPLIAPLAMLGWGASVGGLLGAAAGAGSKEGSLSDLVRDAISSGQVVLVARTRTVQETTIARNVIQAASACEYRDVSTA